MILGFGGPMRMLDQQGVPRGGEHRTFIAGLHDTWSESTTEGAAAGVQVNLTPAGAYMFLGMPMSEITNTAIGLEEVLGAPGAELGERLAYATGWDARMDIIDALIEERMKRARAASPAVVWAWQQLVKSGGNANIGTLAERIGWSRKHLISRFREQIGLPPKTAGRVLRFNRVLRLAARGPEMSWAAIAMTCGYYDQAHLIRDFREFAGVPPMGYLSQHTLH
jgi:AraC-like DNA-binding protein